jgi:hypothetical protein
VIPHDAKIIESPFFDAASGTSLALRVGASFRVRNPFSPDDYRASASRADRGDHIAAEVVAALLILPSILRG